MDDNLAAFKQTYANNPDYYAWYEAVELFIATSTLQMHLRNIYKKVCVHSRTELIDYLESLASQGGFGD